MQQRPLEVLAERGLPGDALRLLGVEPRAFIGYSLGESAALLASRAWPEQHTLFRRTLTSSLPSLKCSWLYTKWT